MNARSLLVVVVVAAVGCSASPRADVTEDPLWSVDEARARWPADSDGRTVISVCWQTPELAAEKAVVRDAIATSWSAVTRVDFVGWGDCSAPTNAADLEITIREVGSATAKFGKENRGLSEGLVLRRSLLLPGGVAAMCPDGTLHDACVGAVAKHEFGHVLGFHHEQNRADAPPTCPDGVSRIENDEDVVGPPVYLGAYDPDSIMNYCARTTTLSAKDIYGARRWYGVREDDAGADLRDRSL